MFHSGSILKKKKKEERKRGRKGRRKEGKYGDSKKKKNKKERKKKEDCEIKKNYNFIFPFILLIMIYKAFIWESKLVKTSLHSQVAYTECLIFFLLFKYKFYSL